MCVLIFTWPMLLCFFYFILPSILVILIYRPIYTWSPYFIFNLLLNVVMILKIVDNIMIIKLLIFMIQLFNQHQVLR